MPPKAHSGFAQPTGVKLYTGTTEGRDRAQDKLLLTYKYGLQTFDQFDWQSTSRDTRLALIFGPLMGMSKAHSAFRVLGQQALTLKNLVVLQLDPTPTAVISCLQGAPQLAKPNARRAAAKELLTYMKSVAAVIRLEYNYDWETGQEVDGLERHAATHDEDAQLVSCMLLVLEREDDITNKGELKHNLRAGHLIYHACWDGLGRWKGLRGDSD